MVIGQALQDAINKQINAELYSSYIYLSMSAYFESLGLPGFANWMRCQAQEEVLHAMKFYHHLCERDGRVVVAAIDGPATDWESPLDAFETAYAHEQKVTAMISALVDLAEQEKDRAANNFLQWFVGEQVEEEASAKAVVDKLNLIKDAPAGLFMVDAELAQRVFVAPPPGGEAGA